MSKYNKLIELAKDLGMIIPVPYLKLELSKQNDDKSISILDRESNSFNRNAYNSMIILFTALPRKLYNNTYGEGRISIKHQNGTVYSLYFASNNLGFIQGAYQNPLTSAAVIDNSDYGILVGTNGAGGETFEDYSLNTKILSGTTSGKLSYQQQTAEISYDAGTKTMSAIHSRFFNNNSGDTINVTECGLSQNYYYDWNHYSPLLIKDVFDAVEVPNLYRLKVTYTISLVYP